MRHRFKYVLLASIFIGILCGLKLHVEDSQGWSIHVPAHGTVLGEFQGVTIYAAGDHNERGPYGMEFQCVEYINRFYMQRLQHKNMTQTGHADSYFWNASEKDLVAFPNGSKTPPQKFDILVFDRANNDGNPGHVAIISNVDFFDNRVDVVQQNSIARRYGGLLKKAVPKETFPIQQNAQGEWFIHTHENRLPVVGWSRPRSAP